MRVGRGTPLLPQGSPLPISVITVDHITDVNSNVLNLNAIFMIRGCARFFLARYKEGPQVIPDTGRLVPPHSGR